MLLRRRGNRVHSLDGNGGKAVNHNVPNGTAAPHEHPPHDILILLARVMTFDGGRVGTKDDDDAVFTCSVDQVGDVHMSGHGVEWHIGDAMTVNHDVRAKGHVFDLKHNALGSAHLGRQPEGPGQEPVAGPGVLPVNVLHAWDIGRERIFQHIRKPERRSLLIFPIGDGPHRAFQTEAHP